MKFKILLNPIQPYSDVLGDNYTKSITPTPVNKLARGLLDGKVRCHTELYEASALAAGSTIKIGKKLNKGDVIKSITLWHDALGSATISIGDAASAARYKAATSVSSAGRIKSDEDASKIDGINYVVTGTNDDVILLTTASAAITGTIKAQIEYLTD